MTAATTANMSTIKPIGLTIICSFSITNISTPANEMIMPNILLQVTCSRRIIKANKGAKSGIVDKITDATVGDTSVKP
jgi:hypothetical protein